MLAGQLALFFLGVVCVPVDGLASPVGGVGVNREALYKQGITFDVFLDRAVERRQMWLDNYAKGGVPDKLLKRARAVPGTWRLLVVAVDSCSDSANIVPYLAHLVSAVDGLEMRIIDSDVGRPVMEAHRTPDGRAATPSIVLLDEVYDEVGCFIERPRELQEWALQTGKELEHDQFMNQKFAWYDRDLGRQTMSEIIALMEAAAQGTTGCL